MTHPPTGPLWALHGLVVQCDGIPLDARPAPAGASPDVVVTWAAPAAVPGWDERPAGRLLAALDGEDGHWLSVVGTPEPGPAGEGEQVDVVFHAVAVASVAPDLRHVTLTLAPDEPPALASVLVGGTVVSVLLALRGHPVLHASAVVVQTADGPGAVAFVGSSGMGKSTMATLACRDGALLLADDVLRTDLDGDRVLVRAGATATRLRPAAAALGEAAGQVEVTADGRASTTLPPAPGEAVPLLALVVPQPDREHDRVRVERATGIAAVLTLASFPRILGWADPVTSGQAHRHWGELARRVPVMTVHVPWGPPFADGLGAQVLAEVLAEAGVRPAGS